MLKVELGLWKNYTATFEDVMVNSMYIYKLETYMYFYWDNGVKQSKGRREGG